MRHVRLSARPATSLVVGLTAARPSLIRLHADRPGCTPESEQHKCPADRNGSSELLNPTFRAICGHAAVWALGSGKRKRRRQSLSFEL